MQKLEEQFCTMNETTLTPEPQDKKLEVLRRIEEKLDRLIILIENKPTHPLHPLIVEDKSNDKSN